jgi:hypothetical protein
MTAEVYDSVAEVLEAIESMPLQAHVQAENPTVN